MTLSSRALLICTFAAGLLACNDQPTAPAPAELVIVEAPSTVGAPGWELIDTLVVRAVDPAGTPRAGVAVTWTVRQGGGSVAATAEATDADGYAKAVWTLGATSGVNQVRASTVDGAQADFESTGEAFRADVVVSNNFLGCGLKAGALWCWGLGFWGTTPAPSLPPPNSYLESQSPGLVDDSHLFTDVAITDDGLCALDSSQAVWCATAKQPAMARQAGLPPIRSLASNGGGGDAAFGVRICGLATSDSTAWCWDVGGSAVQLPASPAFTTLQLSASLACGLLVDSTAACWGASPPGDGHTGPSDTAVAVSGGHQFVEVAVGRHFACGRTTPGVVWCWGHVSYPGSEPDALVPTQLATESSLMAVEWEWIGTYSLGRTLTQWSWGGTLILWPRIASGLEGLPVEKFASNNSFSCVQLADEQVYCYDELWDVSSRIPFDSYSPVQPVRQEPAVGGSP